MSLLSEKSEFFDETCPWLKYFKKLHFSAEKIKNINLFIKFFNILLDNKLIFLIIDKKLIGG